MCERSRDHSYRYPQEASCSDHNHLQEKTTASAHGAYIPAMTASDFEVAVVDAHKNRTVLLDSNEHVGAAAAVKDDTVAVDVVVVAVVVVT